MALTRRRRADLFRYAIYAATIALLAWAALATDWARLQESFFDW